MDAKGVYAKTPLVYRLTDLRRWSYRGQKIEFEAVGVMVSRATPHGDTHNGA